MSYLTALSDWLQRKYGNSLAQLTARAPRDSAVAFWGIESGASGQVGFLLDQDLGTWFKFVVIDDPVSSEQRIRSVIMGALSDSSQLLWKAKLPTVPCDKAGAWKVTLIFLVQSDCRAAWETAIQRLRSQSGFTEEIAIDAIFLRNEEDLRDQLERGGALPHLMLSVRHLLKLPIDQLDGWKSADSEVAKLLQDLPSRFDEEADRELVRALALRVLQEHARAQSPAPGKVRSITRLEVTDTRNITDFELILKGARGSVLARTIFGPNGTGKSGIFEALSFAVSGTSKRLDSYLRDKDEGRVSSENYVQKVLKPLDGSGQPTIKHDGKSALAGLPRDSAESIERLAEVDGTLLAQEDARLFVEMRGSELGARVLSGYSVLARNLQRLCDEEYRVAHGQRQDWLRKFDINASVRRRESRFSNLIQHFLQSQFPHGSQQIDSWLLAVERRFPEKAVEARTLAAAWRDADGRTARETLGESVVRSDSRGERRECVLNLSYWIERRQKAAASIQRLREAVAPAVGSFAQHRSEIEADLALWRKWLDRPQVAQAPTVPKESGVNEQELTARLSELKTTGVALSEHLQHLKQVRETVLPSWTKHHPDQCPTCAADQSQAGGIVAVISGLEQDLSTKIEAARKQYAEVLAQLRSVSQRRQERGECPLSEERRNELAEVLGVHDGHEALESKLRVQGAVAELLRNADALLTAPPIPAAQDPEPAAERLWALIEAEEARGAALWVLPDRWERIKDVVNRQCAVIVDTHLPATLQAVWLELAMVMTPARWNLSGTPMMSQGAKGTETLRVLVGSGDRKVGVRHIFNQAENHILGLAWFFTRYFSSGRARHDLVVMDDPAQEMDQTTFRAFTRWLQTFCRLHERYKIPLTLVLFLHQEDRALDAARATNHQLTSLSWARQISTKESVEQLILLAGGEFAAPVPRPLAELPLSEVSAST